jgi:hypothetical protein
MSISQDLTRYVRVCVCESVYVCGVYVCVYGLWCLI